MRDDLITIFAIDGDFTLLKKIAASIDKLFRMKIDTRMNPSALWEGYIAKDFGVNPDEYDMFGYISDYTLEDQILRIWVKGESDLMRVLNKVFPQLRVSFVRWSIDYSTYQSNDNDEKYFFLQTYASWTDDNGDPGEGFFDDEEHAEKFIKEHEYKKLAIIEPAII